MPEQIYIGNFTKGLKLDRTPFNIDNDSFPILFNSYSWRGQARRKRGTKFLGRLQVQVDSVAVAVNPWENGPLVLVAGAGNLISGYSLESTSTIVPGTIDLFVGANEYTEPSPPDGTLLKNSLADPGSTINYATGAITIAGGGAGPLTGTFSYFPGLPVMGLRQFVSSLSSSQYPLTIAFDTKYSYQINQAVTPSSFYNVTYYKNTNTPFKWSGQDYQQFWTTNYSGAFWATNNKPGFHFVNGVYVAGTGTANITFTFTSGGPFQNLIVGDILFFNEWTAPSTINGLIGTVTTIINAATGTYIVSFNGAQTVAGTGIAQLLTNSIPGQDGIKWYDGDPTSGTGIPTGTNLGWVNFAPPLTALNVSISNLPLGKYYLVGALIILPFKDRLLFFSPYIQTSTGSTIQLQDTVIWSWNGTPYYTDPVPVNQTSNVIAYYVDQTGAGGYQSAGISQPIATVIPNEDILLVGFGGNGRKTRFVYTGNDLQPFLFYTINSELPSSATFSSINLDKGGIDLGPYGIVLTDQQSSQRIDLDIPDSVFQIQALQNGVQRISAIRDFLNEWIYFSYPVNNIADDGSLVCKFPLQSFLFNYRDNTWAIFYENFTTHGLFRSQKKKTWEKTGYSSWSVWNEPWNAGANSPQYSQVIGGNPQGYVLIKDQGTGEAPSGTIFAISNNNGNTQITSYNHCVTAANPNTGTGDYVLFLGALGTTYINGIIGKVIDILDADTFTVDIAFQAGTYLGLGTYTRLSQPLMLTKQFTPYWEQGRQCRLAVQKYLLSFTETSQITVDIYLSQDQENPYNDPINNTPPNSLIYSQLMYTCPESTNLGLTPANTNLQMPTASTQNQIWHRFNTSLIGDSVQI